MRGCATLGMLVAAVCLLLAAPPARAGVEEGLAAFRAGNFAQALSEFRTAADQGNATAMVSLGFMYLRGHGVDVDPKQAAHWLQMAAERGIAPAQHSLALLYYEGRGVARNTAVAANYFESAALQGLADAQYNLGVLYSRGDGVKQDWTLARFWHQKAAEQGVSDAQLALGVMEANGYGTPQDYEAAARWFGKAAAAGNTRARRMLETAFSDLAGEPSTTSELGLPDSRQTPDELASRPAGQQQNLPDSPAGAESPSLPRSPNLAAAAAPPAGKRQEPALPPKFWESPPAPITEQAFRNLQGYAAAGDAGAQVRLAWHYLHGVSAPESPVRSYVWAERSARNASSEGESMAKALLPRLSPRQQSAARAILDPNPRKSP